MTLPSDRPIIPAYPPSVQEVFIESISDPVCFLRSEPGHEEVNELANSLQAMGLLHPVVVARLGNSGFRMVAGYRRLLAAKKLGWKTIPACVIEANECNEIMLSLTENLDRKDADPLRIAEALCCLHMRSGLALRELAVIFKRSPEWLSNLLRVNKYSHFFREAVETGDLHLQHCLEICVLGKVDLMARALRFARRVRPRVKELREYVRLLKRIDEIGEALRSCSLQDEREQLTIELKELNIRLETLEGVEKRNRATFRSREVTCDLCGSNTLRRDMHSVRLCRSCYPKATARLIREDNHDREKRRGSR